VISALNDLSNHTAATELRWLELEAFLPLQAAVAVERKAQSPVWTRTQMEMHPGRLLLFSAMAV